MIPPQAPAVPLQLVLELVRAEEASKRYAVDAGRSREYLLRDPDDSGRYATRRRGRVGRIRPADPAAARAFDRALDTLVDARLIVRGTDLRAGEEQTERSPGSEGSAWGDVAHEGLIQGWTRYQGWIVKDREPSGPSCWRPRPWSGSRRKVGSRSRRLSTPSPHGSPRSPASASAASGRRASKATSTPRPGSRRDGG